jgi:hypothetical protein
VDVSTENEDNVKKFYLVNEQNIKVAEADKIEDFEDYLGKAIGAGRLANINENLSRGISPKLFEYELRVNKEVETELMTMNQKELINEVLRLRKQMDFIFEILRSEKLIRESDLKKF